MGNVGDDTVGDQYSWEANLPVCWPKIQLWLYTKYHKQMKPLQFCPYPVHRSTFKTA